MITLSPRAVRQLERSRKALVAALHRVVPEMSWFRHPPHKPHAKKSKRRRFKP